MGVPYRRGCFVLALTMLFVTCQRYRFASDIRRAELGGKDGRPAHFTGLLLDWRHGIGQWRRLNAALGLFPSGRVAVSLIMTGRTVSKIGREMGRKGKITLCTEDCRGTCWAPQYWPAFRAAGLCAGRYRRPPLPLRRRLLQAQGQVIRSIVVTGAQRLEPETDAQLHPAARRRDLYRDRG